MTEKSSKEIKYILDNSYIPGYNFDKKQLKGQEQ